MSFFTPFLTGSFQWSTNDVDIFREEPMNWNYIRLNGKIRIDLYQFLVITLLQEPISYLDPCDNNTSETNE